MTTSRWASGSGRLLLLSISASMAFQGAASFDAPLGIPAQAAPAVVPTDLTQLFQLMQLQREQQQAQQQQVAGLLKHVLSVQNAGRPAAGGGASTVIKSLDERHFRRIAKFDNKAESWKEWWTHFMAAVRRRQR